MKTSRSRKRPKLTYSKGSSGKINPELAILRHNPNTIISSQT